MERAGQQLSDMLMFCHCVFAHLLKNRFAKVEDQKDALRLYTIQIPHKRERKPPQCYITKWDGRAFLPLLTKPCGNEVISCLAVRQRGYLCISYAVISVMVKCHVFHGCVLFLLSDSGTFLGLGTVTGSVGIYIAFSLQVQTAESCAVSPITYTLFSSFHRHSIQA